MKHSSVWIPKTRVLASLLLLSACSSEPDPAGDTGGGTGGVMPGSGGSTAISGSGGKGGSGGATATNMGTGGKSSGGTGGRMPMAGSGGTMAGAGGTGSGGMGAGGSGGTMGGSGGASGTPKMSAGCGKAPPASDTSIMVGGMTGDYILDLPSNYDNKKAYPLILVWHGFGVDNASFHSYLDISGAAGDDAIVVTPECLNGGQMWPSDMAYPDALLEHFESNYCIDTSRLFTTGHSMGGMYTGQIGCQRGDVFRGDAVLAAPHPSGNCVDGNMAAMMSVGDSDSIADGPTEFAWWADKNGCDFSMKMPVSDPKECTEYGGCEAGKPVRTCTFSGGHEIPPWVAGAVWGFFKSL